MRAAVYLTLVWLLALTIGYESDVRATQHTPSAAERLGHPADAKLLIIHADDVGLGHSVDVASFRALEKKAVSCGSIMVPCPWFTEVASYVKGHPEVDLGLHLTLTSEWKSYRWGPLSSRNEVAGLLDPVGYLWPQVAPVLKNAKPQEVETEIRAQIERALRAGIRPTHLDSHMGPLFSPALFPVYVRLAREYNIPFFAVRMEGAPPAMSALLKDTDIIPDKVVMAGEGIRPEQWMEYYTGQIRNLKPGLTEMIVHLGLDDAELRAITEDHPAFGSAWRQRDYDVMTGPEFNQVLKGNNVILIGWKEIQQHWNPPQ